MVNGRWAMENIELIIEHEISANIDDNEWAIQNLQLIMEDG